MRPTGTSQSSILTFFFPHSSSGCPRKYRPALLPQRLRPWAARGADDVGRGAGLPASRAAAARDAVRSGVAGGGLRGRRVDRGGRAGEEEPGSQPPSRPTEFPGLPQPSPPGVGALADRPARRLASSPAAAAVAWTAPGPTPQPVGRSRALGPNAWASRAEWVAVVGAVPGAPGGERGCCSGASCGDRV